MIKKIAYITDIHLDEPFPIDHGIDARMNWRKILQDVSSRGIEKIVFGGDIGEIEAYEWFFDSLRGFELEMVLGNHDRCPEIMKFYSHDFQQSQDELYYSYEDEFYRYVFMDSSSGRISEAQFEWFRRCLKSSKSLVLFIHHPILAIDTAVDKKFSLQGRDKIVSELRNFVSKVVVFCGHYHMLDERIDGLIEQVVTPASSFQIVKDADGVEVHREGFGYRIISVGKSQITSEVVSL